MNNEERIIATLESFWEEFQGINKKLSAVEQRLNHVEQRFDGFEQRLTNLEQRFDGFEQRLTNLEQQNTRLEHRMSRMEKSLVIVSELLPRVAVMVDELHTDYLVRKGYAAKEE